MNSLIHRPASHHRVDDCIPKDRFLDGVLGKEKGRGVCIYQSTSLHFCI